MSAPHPPARRRGTRWMIAAVAAVAVVVAGVAFALTRPHHHTGAATTSAPSTSNQPTSSATATSTDTAGATSTATAPVTVAAGGTVSLPDGTSVDIAPGSVSADTSVTLTRDGDSPALPTDGLSSAGQPVHIELADGQLTGTATVSLPVTAPADTPDGLDLSPMLAYYDEDTDTWTAVEGAYNAAAHTVTATVDHFSWWNPFTWNYSAIRDSIKQALADMAGIPSGIKPTCAHPAPASVATATATGASLLDYCLDDSNGVLTLRTRSRPDFPLLVTWAGTSSLSTRTEYDIDITSIYLWLAKLLKLQAQNALGLPTGGMAELTVQPDSNSAVIIHATYEPRTQLIGIVDATVRVVLALRSVLKIATTAEQVVSDITASSCLVQHADDLTSDPAGAFTTIVGDCVHDVIGDLTKSAHGLLRIAGAALAALGTLLTVVVYAANTVTSLYFAGRALVKGQTDETITVAAPGSPTTPPSGDTPATGWPVHNQEGPPALWAWFGANFEFPNWVSCTADTSYCIAAIDDQVHVIRRNGLVDVLSIPLATRNPYQALVKVGFTAAQATYLLQSR